MFFSTVRGTLPTKNEFLEQRHSNKLPEEEEWQKQDLKGDQKSSQELKRLDRSCCNSRDQAWKWRTVLALSKGFLYEYTGFSHFSHLCFFMLRCTEAYSTSNLDFVLVIFHFALVFNLSTALDCFVTFTWRNLSGTILLNSQFEESARGTGVFQSEHSCLSYNLPSV